MMSKCITFQIGNFGCYSAPSPQKPMWLGKGKKGRSPSRNRIGLGFQVVLPLRCTLDFGGAIVTPLHLYIEWRGGQKDTQSPWRPFLSRYSIVSPPRPGDT